MLRPSRIATFLAGLALWAPIRSEPVRVAAGILEGLQAARAEAGVGALRFEPALEAAAARRAREVAGRPEGRRFAYDVPIDAYVREAGLRRFVRAGQYVSTQGGYEDEVGSALRNWRSYEDAWRAALDPSWTHGATATARTRDGLLVIVTVFLEEEPPLPDPAELETATWKATNAERTGRGLEALRWDDGLAAVAREHSRDMARRGYVGHDSPEGLGPADRVRGAGIRFRGLAENVARNLHVGDPVASAVEGWIDSRPHRRNLLNAAFTLTGVGVAIDDDGRVIFTQLFLLPPATAPGTEKDRP